MDPAALLFSIARHRCLGLNHRESTHISVWTPWRSSSCCGDDVGGVWGGVGKYGFQVTMK